MKKSYTKDGVLFDVEYKGKKISFPLDTEEKSYRKVIGTDEWEAVAILEQLWIDGELVKVFDNMYLVPTEALFELDDEAKLLLNLPKRDIHITVYEEGNIGGRGYKIGWEAKDNGVDIGGLQRYGGIITGNDREYLLTKEQYGLLEKIDSLEGKSLFAERARDIAEVKKLAETAKAELDDFTDSRDFYYVDEVDLGCKAIDDQTIVIDAEINDIPQEIADCLDKEITNADTFRTGSKRQYVFFDEDAKSKYNDYNRIPAIKGNDVPKFLNNPLSFIDESIEFDHDKFAERVKGIAIHTSSAQPFVEIKKNDDEPGWFDVTAGIRLIDERGELDKFEAEIKADSQEYWDLVKRALESGERYIYYHNQWIKLDYNKLKKFQTELEELNVAAVNGKISEQKIHKILEIYDNIEGFEYDETPEEKLVERKLSIYPVPKSFKGTLKDYQVEGYSFLCSQYDAQMGSLLADDMGLGKTAQVIAFMLHLRDLGKLKPALIVVPAVLIENWVSEIRKFGPSDIYPYTHSGPQRYKSPDIINTYEVVITTYETLSRDQMIMGQIHWAFMACDETQKIKNFRTLAACAVKAMNADCRIAMTGTPVENRLGELWSIVDYVQPGLLKEYTWFKKEFEEPIQLHKENAEEKTAELVDLINPIFLRRLKENVLVGLPEKYEKKYEVELSKLQIQLYKECVESYEDTDDGIAVIKAIQQLIMICSHPRIAHKDWNINIGTKKLLAESTKLEDALRILKEIKKRNEKVLIFTKYRKMQNILKLVIYEEFGIDAKVINGENNSNRQDCVERFNASAGFNVLILSPKAAGVGLNITGANNVIHYTREWNPAIENQATDRVYRIGQSRDVNVFYPIASYSDVYTVEQKLNNLLEGKRELMRNVVIPVDLAITEDELKECLAIHS